jgi:hypothetical protein
MTNHPAIRAALIAATGTLALMAAACGASGTSSSAQSGPSTAASPSAGAGEVITGDTGTGGGGTTTPTPAAKSPTPKTNTTTAASGPQIVSFKVSKQPMCPVVGTPDAPYSAPGQDVTLSWKVTGATKVALSVDGPGIYQDNYKAEDSQQLSFGCDTSKPQSSHKYILTVTGGGVTKTQNLTVTIQSKP